MLETLSIGNCVITEYDHVSAFKTSDDVRWPWEVTLINAGLTTELWLWCHTVYRVDFRMSISKPALYFKTRDHAVNFATLKSFAGL